MIMEEGCCLQKLRSRRGKILARYRWNRPSVTDEYIGASRQMSRHELMRGQLISSYLPRSHQRNAQRWSFGNHRNSKFLMQNNT